MFGSDGPLAGIVLLSIWAAQKAVPYSKPIHHDKYKAKMTHDAKAAAISSKDRATFERRHG
jgi:hypothetical protein